MLLASNMDKYIGSWTDKGATLSDKSARKLYKLTQEEILEGINTGKLQYKINYIYENPWYRLIKSEVEILIKKKYGEAHLLLLNLNIELKEIEIELKTINNRSNDLNRRKADINNTISEMKSTQK
ncbi:MAG: hypothetical protein D4R64_18485 [Porphyromonadaceae bacterium]|nr:MAG: hypothetical protein D4R64_18485 [Porphyromonadaceae bacterium]